MVKSANRVCLILDLVGHQKGGLKHSEIIKALNIPTSSLSALLADLIDQEYLSMDPVTRRYSLGSKILLLAGEYLNGLDIVETTRPLVRNLSITTGESVAVAVRSGFDIVIVCSQDSPQAIKRSIQIGERSPMYCTACGKAILAYLPIDEVDRYLSSVKLISATRRTITDSQGLKAELKRIRSKGIAYNREELLEGIIAIAAPVLDLHGNAVSAIVVSLPSSRWSSKKEKHFETLVREASATVSKRLGFKDRVAESAN
jgi:IclR family KDG regulon transcriptional repressor